MTRKKEVAVETGERTYTLYDQRQPLKREQGSKTYYEANLVRIGEIKAMTPGAALELAKARGLAEKPVVWGPDTEKMRDRYQQRPVFDRHQDD